VRQSYRREGALILGVCLLMVVLASPTGASEEYILVDSLPLPVRQVKPVFTDAAMKRCAPGYVLVHVDMDSSGAVVAARVARAFNRWNCPDSALALQIDDACVTAARLWRFEGASVHPRRDSCTLALKFPDPDAARRVFGVLVGRVTCGANDLPAPYSDIDFLGSRHGTSADSEGRYMVDNAPAGRWTLRVRTRDCGWAERRLRIVAGRVDTVEIKLGEGPGGAPGGHRRGAAVHALLPSATQPPAHPVSGNGQAFARGPLACEQYAAALNDVLLGHAPPIESLYEAGMRAAHALAAPASSDTESVLGALDEATYARMRLQMQGLTMWREEGEAVFPDPAFFLLLARARGDAADTAFFDALGSTYRTGSPFPVYLDQQTDESGCTNFGSGRLVATFAVWQAFVTRYPRRYAVWANDELREIEDVVTSSTCACGDQESVLRELREFVKRFPLAPVTQRVRERLETIQSGAGGIRYHCVSG
jgi:hypothetical protein